MRLLCDADGIGRSDFREAIEDCSTDFELGYLAIKGTRDEALTEQFEAVHLGLDQTALVITTPLLPDGPAELFHRAQGFIAGIDAGTVPGSCLAVAANGMTGSAPRPAMAAWQFLVS